MSKDAYYFSHDANARRDPKILAMRNEYGNEGYGWYWILIEMLSEQEGYKLKHAKWVTNALAMEMLCDTDKAENFVDSCISDYELFESDGEYFWSNSLIRRMELREEKRKKKVEAGKKGADSRWKNNSAIAEPKQEDGTAIAEHGKGKEKERKGKGKEIKDIKDYMSEIKDLLNRYPKEFTELNKVYWEVIRMTRSSKKIQPSVICNSMKIWSDYPVQVVEYALKRHIEIADTDKDEKYTIGIMRRTTKAEAIDKIDRMIQKGGATEHEANQYANLW